MNVVESIRGEYLRYKKLAEAAIRQAPDEQLSAAASPTATRSRRSAGTCRGT